MERVPKGAILCLREDRVREGGGEGAGVERTGEFVDPMLFSRENVSVC